MTLTTWVTSRKALVAELLLAGLLLGYGWFSVYRLVAVVLLATFSLWIRGQGWNDVGLKRPPSLPRALLQGALSAAGILIAIRLVIVPMAVAVTGVPVDFSALRPIGGDLSQLAMWLVQAWTLAAFGEEMVFRAYLLTRIGDLTGRSPIAAAVALLISSILFGWAHRYLGPAGMVATGSIGALVALLYLGTRNLWPVILCHALVDTAALLTIYFGWWSVLVR